MGTAVLMLAGVAGLGSRLTSSPKHLETPFEFLTPQAGPLAHDPLETLEEPSEDECPVSIRP
jgi:hypothetical protein